MQRCNFEFVGTSALWNSNISGEKRWWEMVYSKSNCRVGFRSHLSSVRGGMVAHTPAHRGVKSVYTCEFAATEGIGSVACRSSAESEPAHAWVWSESAEGGRCLRDTSGPLPLVLGRNQLNGL